MTHEIPMKGFTVLLGHIKCILSHVFLSCDHYSNPGIWTRSPIFAYEEANAKLGDFSGKGRAMQREPSSVHMPVFALMELSEFTKQVRRG